MEFDREIVEHDVTNNKELSERRRDIKDEIRKSVINDIALLLQQIIENQPLFKAQDADRIVAKSLEVMERLMDWANLDLFLSNLPYLVLFLKDPILQTPSAKCIYSIIYKGMEPIVKLQLIEKLNLIAILSEWDPSSPGQDENFCQVMATIVNKLGSFLLNCIMGKEGISLEATDVAKSNFTIVLALSFKCLNQEYISVSMGVTELINHYLSVLKHIPLEQIHIDALKMLTQIISKRIQYPKWYDIEHLTFNNSMEEMYNYYRAELSSIFGNMLLIQPVQEQLAECVGNLILNLKNNYSTLSPQEKEAPLQLLYKLAESYKGSLLI